MLSQLPEENIWDYPRPPAIEPVQARIRVVYKDIVLANTTHAYRLLETGHPPSYYIPPKDVNEKLLIRNNKSTYCHYKGLASYYDFQPSDGQTLVESRVWSYDNPIGSDGKYMALKGYYSFYVNPWDCFVNDEKVEPQPGDFYGGWKTKNIRGKMNEGPGAWSL